MAIQKKTMVKSKQAKSESLPQVTAVFKETIREGDMKMPAKFAKVNEMLLKAKLLDD